jgi:hypothetical protein
MYLSVHFLQLVIHLAGQQGPGFSGFIQSDALFDHAVHRRLMIPLSGRHDYSATPKKPPVRYGPAAVLLK